jgi:peptidoglycan/LPS O-acetylase OafA/YrhL
MHGHFRREIQGLRAVAVLLVIANHMRAWPAGGFIGVDVFFVVSGYVITRLLLREVERSGRVSLREFYRRRVKRIMPAAVVVLGTTAIVASLVYSPSQQAQTNTDIAWALGFAANWRFVINGTDYLHAADAVSPVQHFWSLSVEEQFYFVWPVLIILAALATKKHPAQLRGVLAVAASLIACGSFIFAMHESVALPTAAYFSTFSRGWELALGCLAACAAPWTRRLPAPLQTPIAWAGLAGITASIFTIDAASRFPAPSAALPVLATVAILIAGERSELQNVYPLTNRVTTWIGDLSYSLYLWHFPVLILLDAVLPDRGRKYDLIAIALIGTLALLSYYFIENPLRRSEWRFPHWRRWEIRPAAHWKAATSVLVLLAIGTSVSAFALSSRPAAEPQPVDLTGFTSTSTHAELTERAAVTKALQAQSWPKLAPAVMDPGVVAQAPEWVHDGCLGDERGADADPFQNALRCSYGNPSAPHTIAVVGDSHAISYVPGVRGALGQDWRIEVYTLEECPAVWVDVSRGDGAPHPDCPRFHQQVADHLHAEHPDVIMMTSATVALTQLTSRATGDALTAEWRSGTVAAVRALASATDRLVLVDDPPSTANLASCYTRLNGPGRCVTSVNTFYLQMVDAQRAAVEVLHLRNVSYPSTARWFCSSEGLCPAFVGRTPVAVDGYHLTDAMARKLAPLLREVLLSTTLGNPAS